VLFNHFYKELVCVIIACMKPIVGIFAHPDDEVLVGPGGTLAKFAREGRDTFLICVTDGDAGMNSSDDKRNLGEIRREELQASAKILGIKDVIFLGYKDGTLSNNLYHEIAEKITTILGEIDPEIIITMEHRGISGHLDHIAVSMISSYIYEHMHSIKEIWYYALTREDRKALPPYYIYFPDGYKLDEIDKIVDITSVWDQKVKALHQHKSQLHDMEKALNRLMNRPKEEGFFVVKRPTKDTE
jgi:LmbE family N-acetylglucosaminyl deacetylase